MKRHEGMASLLKCILLNKRAHLKGSVLYDSNYMTLEKTKP